LNGPHGPPDSCGGWFRRAGAATVRRRVVPGEGNVGNGAVRFSLAPLALTRLTSGLGVPLEAPRSTRASQDRPRQGLERDEPARFAPPGFGQTPRHCGWEELACWSAASLSMSGFSSNSPKLSLPGLRVAWIPLCSIERPSLDSRSMSGKRSLPRSRSHQPASKTYARTCSRTWPGGNAKPCRRPRRESTPGRERRMPRLHCVAREDGPSGARSLGRGSPGPSLGEERVGSLTRTRPVTTLPQAGVETPRKVRRLPLIYPHGSTGTRHGWG
jgi:hypothetical protein